MAESNSPEAVRARLLAELLPIAHKLPNGLLTRLVADAKFYAQWQKGKRSMRGRGKMAQTVRLQEQMEEKRWKGINRERGSRVQ